MSKALKSPLELTALPDWAVITDQQTIELLGLSLDTLRRLDRGRDGPPRVRLSSRRYGRPVGELRKWLRQRLSERSYNSQTQTSDSRGITGATGEERSRRKLGCRIKAHEQPKADRRSDRKICHTANSEHTPGARSQRLRPVGKSRAET